MAIETGRIIKRKKIFLPDDPAFDVLGGTTVDIPVISQISFLDASERGQETQYTIDNTDKADRDVRIASVLGNGDGTDETGKGGPDGDLTVVLQVDRIDKFRLLDNSDRAQETFPEPDSKTVAQPSDDPPAPPYFTTHAKTHLVKYINSTDDGNYIISELVDGWNFGDGSDRGQETQYTLINPPDGQIDSLTIGTDDDGMTTIAIDSGIEEIKIGVAGTNDDPIRTDPFQNIVDFKATGPLFFFTIWPTTASSNNAEWQNTGVPEGELPPVPPGPPASMVSSTDSFTGFSLACKSFAQGRDGDGNLVQGDGPTVTLSQRSFSYAPWTFWHDGGTANTFGARVSPGDGTTPSGPPLTIRGRTSQHFTANFTLTLTVSGVIFLGLAGPYCEVRRQPGEEFGFYYSGMVGVIVADVNVPGAEFTRSGGGSYTLTVSQDPFTFMGKRWKAVGLPISQSYSVTTDISDASHPPNGPFMDIMCTIADDDGS